MFKSIWEVKQSVVQWLGLMLMFNSDLQWHWQQFPCILHIASKKSLLTTVLQKITRMCESFIFSICKYDKCPRNKVRHVQPPKWSRPRNDPQIDPATVTNLFAILRVFLWVWAIEVNSLAVFLKRVKWFERKLSCWGKQELAWPCRGKNPTILKLAVWFVWLFCLSFTHSTNKLNWLLLRRKAVFYFSIDPWNFLQKVHFWDVLVIFRLDLGQITFNPVENAFATQQLAFLATSVAF